MSYMHLRIGIENEMFLEKRGDHTPALVDRWQIEKYATDHLLPFYNNKKHGKALLRVDFSHDSHPGHHDDQNKTGLWTVTTDRGIGHGNLDSGPRDVEGWPLEFVSPILDFCACGTWQEEVQKHWDKLLAFGDIYINSGCATHVHVSPEAEKMWSLEQLKQVAQAVLYFEEAFKVIVAPSRREHDRTKFNKANNRTLKDLDFGDCCKLIQECVDADHLVSLLQPPESRYALLNRHYAWNFINTMEGKIGTIEFRCAPGVQTAEDCLIWVELGAYFVRAAAQFGTKAMLEKEYPPTVEGLKKFIQSAEFEGMGDSRFWEIPFNSLPGSGAPMKSDEEMRDVFTEKMNFDESLKAGTFGILALKAWPF